jgi:hypothetical protein
MPNWFRSAEKALSTSLAALRTSGTTSRQLSPEFELSNLRAQTVNGIGQAFHRLLYARVVEQRGGTRRLLFGVTARQQNGGTESYQASSPVHHLRPVRFGLACPVFPVYGFVLPRVDQLLSREWSGEVRTCEET